MNTLDGPLRRHTAGFLDIRPQFTVTEPPEWTLAAVCASTDPEAFYPEKGGSTREAKLVCRGCPVTQECLSYALENAEMFGVWGGLSERERRRLKAAHGHHICPSCSRKFVSLHGLTCHMNTHAGEQHHCPEFGCGRSFPTSHGRAMHQRRAHGGFDPMIAKVG